MVRSPSFDAGLANSSLSQQRRQATRDSVNWAVVVTSINRLLVAAALTTSGTFIAAAVANTERPDEATLKKYREQAAVTELWEPVPRPVEAGINGAPPSDAIVLFDGKNLDQWESVNSSPPQWEITDGHLVVVPGTGNLRTRQRFSDVQLHIEWRTPAIVAGEGQDRGNSGVFLMERYEVQVLDSFENTTYPNGQAASVYKQHIPLVNASRAPGEWQTYDIVFMAPQFDRDGRIRRPATVTVLHNGVLVQNNVTLHGPTEYIGEPQYIEHGKAALELQDHGSPVAYRNVWIREL
jgi:hypothetical protein